MLIPSTRSLPDFRTNPCGWLQMKGFMGMDAVNNPTVGTTAALVSNPTTGGTTTGGTTATNSTATPSDTPTTTTTKIKRAMADFGGMMEGVLGA